ncbi:hypothetical protein BCR44DRAFT_36563 [Catenaria anguillulae PL171]|uniref:Uncharacterized protein n=1 Tax=Catenaria anguillulae PL171 TaxID=765915 RepID=A0A1Y2I1F9_9FUNG|nr:hypothetical protein BCR44DRAFT_36563 [Catenaria anguillulae PL171]
MTPWLTFGSVAQGQRTDAVNELDAKMLTSTRPAAQAPLAVKTSGIRAALRSLGWEPEELNKETDNHLDDGS